MCAGPLFHSQVRALLLLICRRPHRQALGSAAWAASPEIAFGTGAAGGHLSASLRSPRAGECTRSPPLTFLNLRDPPLDRPQQAPAGRARPVVPWKGLPWCAAAGGGASGAAVPASAFDASTVPRAAGE
eukprot:SAG25_NODE_147_length_13803_cov_29.064361_16_plen_129_part_00